LIPRIAGGEQRAVEQYGTPTPWLCQSPSMLMQLGLTHKGRVKRPQFGRAAQHAIDKKP